MEEIKWQLDEIIEVHDSNFCEWSAIGKDAEGNEYTGIVGADKNHPIWVASDIYNIDKTN